MFRFQKKDKYEISYTQTLLGFEEPIKKDKMKFLRTDISSGKSPDHYL
jgi:hypothetical protein